MAAFEDNEITTLRGPDFTLGMLTDMLQDLYECDPDARI